MSQNIIEKFKVKKTDEKYAVFKSPPRKGIYEQRHDDKDLPGPFEYAESIFKTEKKEKGRKHPFGTKQQRLKTFEVDVPPVGTYDTPGSFEIR